MLKIYRYTIRAVILTFALIGFILMSGYIAMRLGFTNTKGTIDNQTVNFIQRDTTTIDSYTSFPLAHTPEWIAFRQAVVKDIPLIIRVSKETGIPARLLVAILVPEQMRLFHSNRAIFKEVFAPLKVLGSQSQFSWGIFGVKDDTARAIESHLQDRNSPYHLGKNFEKMLSFTSSNENDVDQERFARITDERNHLYSYLYAALYIAQIESQWEKSGYKISDRPEVIATLWNLGFEKSSPHKNPKSGGAVLDIGKEKYSFGEIARLFYYSDEMIELLPIEKTR